ncbi:histamine H3 receptor-like [Littorina saxatilis]|uniref:G-protein coupled receptors family 1 profile domain-containing protein n=1 Tax=Littorina saxatilis TaxID=31220 RepID=A0AAN9B6L0_9CAEN
MTSANASSEYLYPLPITVTIGVLTSLVAIVTTVFNTFTLVAFVFSKSLRNFGDYFILNLAIADLAIGVMSIPPYIPVALTGRWAAGKPYCLFWLLWDYVTPAASTFNMCVVSIDRYLLVANPIWYRRCQSRRLLLLMMLTPWVIVTLVYMPAILLWDTISGERHIEEGQCYVPYASNLPFLLFGSFIEFIFPFSVMIVINLLIVTNIRQRMKKRTAGNLGPRRDLAPSVFSTKVAPAEESHTRMSPENMKSVAERNTENELALESDAKDLAAKSTRKQSKNLAVGFTLPEITKQQQQPDQQNNIQEEEARQQQHIHQQHSDANHPSNSAQHPDSSQQQNANQQQNTQQQTEARPQHHVHQQHSDANHPSNSTQHPDSSQQQNANQQQNTQQQTEARPQHHVHQPQSDANHPSNSAQHPDLSQQQNANQHQSSPAQEPIQKRSVSSQRQQQSSCPEVSGQEQHRRANHFRRDRRAARSLFILVFVFTLCWLPFEVLALVSAVCPTCINPVLFDATFWLLWLNSMINPILYPLLHRRFREAFVALLKRAGCYCCRGR